MLPPKHLAIIPARRNSVGFPFKNRKFFEKKYSFLKKINFFDDIIVSTNDEFLIKICIKKKISYLKRKEKFSGPKISIKTVILNLIKELKLSKNDFIWLFYIPLIFNSKADILKTKKIINNKKISSICGFIETKKNPFNTWLIKNNKAKQLIKNDIYRRQDVPKVYEHHHHICAFKVAVIKKLNSELISNFTFPYIVSNKTKNKLIEIDTREDYIKIKNKNDKKTS